MAIFRALLVAGTLAVAAAQSLYDFSSSTVLTELTDANFEATVVQDKSAVWVVEFYANWCGHCKQFAKGYEKAATNLKGIVKFGAVNAEDNKGIAATYGVQGYPAVKIFQPESSRNPYTGKMYKEAADYQGPRTARGVVDAATTSLPSYVVEVTDKNIEKFRANGSLPKALVFTNKPETTSLFKALSIRVKGRLSLGEVRQGATATFSAFGVEEPPAIVIVQSETVNGAALKFDGEMKLEAIATFLEEHATATATAEPSAGATATATADGLAEVITADNVAEKVVGADPWILLFGEAGTGAEALAESVYGQVKVGIADATLAESYGVKSGNGVAMLKYGTAAKTAKHAKAFGATEAALDEAKKAALDSLPEDYVEKLTPSTMDMWMSGTVGPSSPLDYKAMCLLFTDKKEVPHMFRSVGMRFEGKMGFGMVPASMGARFNVQKTPAVLIMFPGEAPDGESGQMQLQGMQYSPQMHGKFNFGNIANFVSSAMQSLPKASGSDSSADGAAPQQPKKEKEPMPSKRDLGPLIQLTRDNFDTACSSAAGLCAIVLLDGSPSNTNQEAHLEMLTKLRNKRAGGPLSFSWVDATCHLGFAAGFGLSETDLPTMIVLSPSKKRWARAIGAFDADSLGTFGSGVATGRVRTDDIAEIPQLDDVDCSTFARGGEEVVEDDGMGDEIMAEILAEEAREREEREAEATAAAAVAADGTVIDQRSAGELSDIEKLEREIEECDTVDLMCWARHEVLMKKINKKKDLEAKLKEIAAKKKKAKKKAAKKAKKAAM